MSRTLTDSASDPVGSTATQILVAAVCFTALVSSSATEKYAMASMAGLGRAGSSTRSSTGIAQRAARGLQRRRQPEFQGGRVDAAHQFPQFGQGLLGSGARLGDQLARVAAGGEALLGAAQHHGDATSRAWVPSCRSRSSPAQGGGRVVHGRAAPLLEFGELPVAGGRGEQESGKQHVQQAHPAEQPRQQEAADHTDGREGQHPRPGVEMVVVELGERMMRHALSSTLVGFPPPTESVTPPRIR
ncbi:hypothetical protein NS14008_38065 [Nocardia seriolae]|nr:hypothetical protein NS14008_38065 [Nocardia seriolae]